MDGGDQDSRVAQVRRRAEQRLRVIATFVGHVVFYLIVVMAMLIDGETLHDVALFSLFWLPLLLAHGFVAFGIWRRLVDQMTQRELERSAPPQKVKRSQAVRLSDDGELISDEDQATQDMAHSSGMHR